MGAVMSEREPWFPLSVREALRAVVADYPEQATALSGYIERGIEISGAQAEAITALEAVLDAQVRANRSAVARVDALEAQVARLRPLAAELVDAANSHLPFVEWVDLVETLEPGDLGDVTHPEATRGGRDE